MTEPATASRVALVGASSVVGRELKAQLADAGYPGAAVELLDLEEQVGLLTEYGEEARVVIEAAEGNLREHTLACFCGDRDTARRFAPTVTAAGGLAIDCTGAWTTDPGAKLATTQNAALVGGDDGLVAVAHPATLLLAALREALGDTLDGATVTLLLPASEASEDGPEELAQQSAAFMNFGEVPDRVFGRRLAFDVYPAAAPVECDAMIVEQLRLLSLPAPALAAVRVPVFHGLAAMAHLQAECDAVREQLATSGVGLQRLDEEGKRVDSPARFTGSAGLDVGAITDDGRGGCWLWLLLDNYRATATVALEVIAARLAPPAETVN